MLFGKVLLQFIIMLFEKVCAWVTCSMCSSGTVFLGLSVLWAPPSLYEFARVTPRLLGGLVEKTAWA